MHRDQLDHLPPGVWPGAEEWAFAIRRFDRDAGRLSFHIEDLAQVCRRRDLAALRELVRRIAFSVLISNGDAPLKNPGALAGVCRAAGREPGPAGHREPQHRHPLADAARLTSRGVESVAATVLARVRGHCGELVLRRAGTHFEVIANGVFLMDTRGGESERLLARAAADRMPAGGHLLLGGLGVGFSLAAAVEHPRVRLVTVVEREPAVIEWVRGPLAGASNGALAGERVRCVEADLVDYLAAAGPFDAICLDVDNGPEWTVTEGNRALYGDAGLRMIKSRLTEGGVLAVWSASAAPAFATRLRARFDEIEVLAVPVPRGEPDTVFVAR